MSFQLLYDQINTSFSSKRSELLDLLINATPRLADSHKRKWRVQQLENTITDVKSTIAACNIQIDQERVVLDELSAENTRLNAQSAKLKEDLKLLEGVTGMKAVLPSDGDAEILSQINNYAENFRKNSADFYFNIGTIKQELTPDEKIGKEAQMMVSTFQDFLDLQFNTRAAEVQMSRDIEDLSVNTTELKKRVEDENASFNRKFKNQKKEAQEEFDSKQNELVNKLTTLRSDYAAIESAFDKMQKQLNTKVDELIEKEKTLSNRCKHLTSFNVSLHESMRRRTLELEMELDRFENRLHTIRSNPNAVDRKLINMSLVLGEKSKLIFDAIKSMRAEISKINQDVRESREKL